MTTMVSARALWPKTADWPSPLFHCTIDGWGYISDRYVMLPVARLAALPVGYGNLVVPLPRQAEDGFAVWLTSTVLPDPSDRVFDGRIIEPLEAAGFKVRPLEGVRDAHGICDPDLQLVGLAIPLRRPYYGQPPVTTARAAA